LTYDNVNNALALLWLRVFRSSNCCVHCSYSHPLFPIRLCRCLTLGYAHTVVADNMRFKIANSFATKSTRSFGLPARPNLQNFERSLHSGSHLVWCSQERVCGCEFIYISCLVVGNSTTRPI
jgi:hypothetical protein